MREIIARIVSILTVCVVGALSLQFASVHNPREGAPTVRPPEPTAPTAAPTGTPGGVPAAAAPPAEKQSAARAEIQRGRTLYEQQNCSTCHSVAGEGNPRYPLDRVAELWDATDLEEWVTGTGSAAEFLPAAIAKRKQRYRDLPREEMTALIAYLSSLEPVK